MISVITKHVKLYPLQALLTSMGVPGLWKVRIQELAARLIFECDPAC
jgi:hypothetical protein